MDRGRRYDLLVEGLHLRNVAIVQGGLGAMAQALVALGHAESTTELDHPATTLQKALHRHSEAFFKKHSMSLSYNSRLENVTFLKRSKHSKTQTLKDC